MGDYLFVYILVLLMTYLTTLTDGLQERLRHYYEDEGWVNEGDRNTISSPPPRFIGLQQNVTAEIGQRAELRCRVVNLGDRKVIWGKAGQLHPFTVGLYVFVSDTRVSISHDKESGDWVLSIRDVEVTDEGIYQCKINAKDVLENHYDVRLNVQVIHVHGTEVVSRGSRIHLVCNTSRQFEPHGVKWFKEDKAMKPFGGVEITTKTETDEVVSMLTIKKSTLTDSGNYYCRGSASNYAHISVNVVNAPVEKRESSEAVVMAFTKSGSSSRDFPKYGIVVLAVFYLFRTLS